MVIFGLFFHHTTHCRSITIYNILPMHSNFAPILTNYAMLVIHRLSTPECTFPLVFCSTSVPTSISSFHLGIKKFHIPPFGKLLCKEFKMTSIITSRNYVSSLRLLVGQATLFSRGVESMGTVGRWVWRCPPFTWYPLVLRDWTTNILLFFVGTLESPATLVSLYFFQLFFTLVLFFWTEL